MRVSIIERRDYPGPNASVLRRKEHVLARVAELRRTLELAVDEERRQTQKAIERVVRDVATEARVHLAIHRDVVLQMARSATVALQFCGMRDEPYMHPGGLSGLWGSSTRRARNGSRDSF